MFKALYEVARHTPLHLIITPNGAQLRIIVTPKPSGMTSENSGLAKPFSLVGTPEELDAEFAATVVKYTSAVNDVRKSLDLPLDAVEAERKKVEKKETAKAEKAAKEKAEAEKRSASAAAAAKTRAENAAKKKAEAETKAKARADARAAKKEAKSKPKPALPGATEPAPAADKSLVWPFPTETADAPAVGTPRPGLPGKAECIKDYQQLKLKHGDKLTRRLFIKKAETSRRYEKLWANWEKFVKEAGAQQELPLDPAPAAAATNTGPALDAEQPVSAGSAASSASGAIEGSNPSGSEPLEEASDTEQRAEAEEQASQPSPIAVLERSSRKLLGIYAGDPSPGELILLTMDGRSSAGKFLVDNVVSGVEIVAHEVLEQPYMLLDADTHENHGETGEIYAAGDAVAELTMHGDFRVHEVLIHSRAYHVRNAARPKFAVYDDDDCLIAEYKWAPAAGEKLTVDGFAHAFRVVGPREAGGLTARRILPTKNRIVVDGTGELLGHTEEVYEIADQVAELTDKEYRVVKVELDAYAVKAAKPRMKGPAATTETAITE